MAKLALFSTYLWGKGTYPSTYGLFLPQARILEMQHSTAQQRIAWVDILRGFAIITMVQANLAYLLAEPRSLWFRAFGSFAAPMFVALAGMMVCFTATTKHRPFSYYLTRAGLIAAVGVSLDALAWGIYPFMTYDVLYVIALGVLLAYFMNRMPSIGVIMICISIFILTPILQHILGYTYYPTEYYLSGELTAEVEKQTCIFNHWLVDGWFPVFPWIGFAFIGVVLERFRRGDLAKGFSPSSKSTFVAGIIGLMVGVVLWIAYSGELYIREGFSELFYQPTIGYIVTSLGLMLMLIYTFQASSDLKVWIILRILGEAPLFMYIFHIFIVAKIVPSFWQELRTALYWVLYAAIIIVMIAIGVLIRNIKRGMEKKSFIFRFLFGG